MRRGPSEGSISTACWSLLASQRTFYVEPAVMRSNTWIAVLTSIRCYSPTDFKRKSVWVSGSHIVRVSPLKFQILKDFQQIGR